MVARENMEKLACYALVALVIVAAVAGVFMGAAAYLIDGNYPLGFLTDTWTSWNSWVLLAMLILGVILGLLSATTNEVHPPLTATIALVVASLSNLPSSFANVWSPLERVHPLIPYLIVTIFNYIAAFAAPAAVLIAVRAVIGLDRKRTA